jgi:hypothetical protein
MVCNSTNTGKVAPTPAAASSETRERNHESMMGPEMPTARVIITGHEIDSRDCS